MTDDSNPPAQGASAKALPQTVADLPTLWADAKPSQFQLLRLATQPAAKGRKASPLRFARLNRVEKHHPQQSLLRLSVELPDKLVHKELNRIEFWADHQTRELRVGPEDGLQIDPINRGLGRFLLAQGVIWARLRWGAYQLIAGPLPNKGALDETSRARRDHCLKSLGLDVSYEDKLQLKASQSGAKVSDLNSTWNLEKLQVVDLLDAGSILQKADQSLQDQAMKIRQLEERQGAFQRNESGLRFSIGALAGLSGFLCVLLLLIVFS